jgi:hypothetical protein
MLKMMMDVFLTIKVSIYQEDITILNLYSSTRYDLPELNQ